MFAWNGTILVAPLLEIPSHTCTLTVFCPSSQYPWLANLSICSSCMIDLESRLIGENNIAELLTFLNHPLGPF